MGPREIPSLSVLCLRAIGNPKCNTEETFRVSKGGKPSTASRLLRSFHHRPVLNPGESVKEYLEKARDEILASNIPSIEWIPMNRTPSIGTGSGRRKQANDIDLNHPWIATFLSETSREEKNDNDDGDDVIPGNPQEQALVAEHGSCALDLLQSYVDALVELGRMDDNRLGLSYFVEVKRNIELQYEASCLLPDESTNDVADEPPMATAATTAAAVVVPPVLLEAIPIPKKKKRKRGSSLAATNALKKKKEAEAKAKKEASILAAVPKSRGSLSLHNCEILGETSSNLLASKVLRHICALDLTGLQVLTDFTLQTLLESAGLQLQRLSLKNCRRLTDASIHYLCEHSPNLYSLDIGGDYNIHCETVISCLELKTHRKGRGFTTTQGLVHLRELHAGGIGPAGGWTDDLLPALFALRGWKALTLGFSPRLTFAGWKEALLSVEHRFAAPAQEHHEGVLPDGSGGGMLEDPHGAAATPPENNNNNNNENNMCQTLVSLGIAFCEQQLVDNAWLGLMGRHLPNLRALDVRGNHQLNTITSWYDGRATIASTTKRQRQSLVVLARYCGISQNSIEDTKRIYPLAAGGDRALTVVTESGGIGWGILRQERKPRPTPAQHAAKRAAAAKAVTATPAAPPSVVIPNEEEAPVASKPNNAEALPPPTPMDTSA